MYIGNKNIYDRSRVRAETPTSCTMHAMTHTRVRVTGSATLFTTVACCRSPISCQGSNTKQNRNYIHFPIKNIRKQTHQLVFQVLNWPIFNSDQSPCGGWRNPSGIMSHCAAVPLWWVNCCGLVMAECKSLILSQARLMPQPQNDQIICYCYILGSANSK